MTYVVELESDLYGVDEYEYDTLDEAFAGMRRLWETCLNHYMLDGEVRRITLVVGDEDEEFDDEDDGLPEMVADED